VSAMPQKDALVGTVLEGAYRITRLIGQGGMGAVYEAVQLRLNKRVAVKLMAGNLAADHEALARFHREPRSRRASDTRISSTSSISAKLNPASRIS